MEDAPIKSTHAACIIRIDDHLVVLRKKAQSHFSLPDVAVNHSPSPACELHRATFSATGFNVHVTHILGESAVTDTTYFNCQLAGNFDSSTTSFPTPYWSQDKTSAIFAKDPFTLTRFEWHNSDELVTVLDMFNQSTEKHHDNHRVE
ncbi:hypothetical protein OE749_08775 [Aestuariibacter sp. AA17]|uniref:Nudix hydrolase domain-containing protein n=1 Tax=Fluctibacter corallii TaxID=2984329 RepID=A0ABT3A7X7_9ALTE|nr:hypothetical protein [Aestuariibacter sp. AA17]